MDYVVIGIDRKFTYDKLRFAHAAITRGHAQFVATNRDATFPMEDGEIPGGGSLVAALATATGREPVTIGKPETHAYEAILHAAGVTALESVMVGDRLDTDILVGRRAGARTLLVLTGVTSAVQAENAPPEQRPDLVIGDLRRDRLGQSTKIKNKNARHKLCRADLPSLLRSFFALQGPP